MGASGHMKYLTTFMKRSSYDTRIASCVRTTDPAPAMRAGSTSSNTKNLTDPVERDQSLLVLRGFKV